MAVFEFLRAIGQPAAPDAKINLVFEAEVCRRDNGEVYLYEPTGRRIVLIEVLPDPGKRVIKGEVMSMALVEGMQGVPD